MAALIALILAVFSFIAGKAGMKLISRIAAWTAALVFIGWLASGPGPAIIEWFQNPSVDVPSVDINR